MSIVDGRYRHGLRRMVGRPVDERARAATPLELLFYLTFVVAFGVAASQLAHGIVVGHWATATLAFVFAMFSVVWAWINVSWFASAFDTDDWLYRLLTTVQMAGVIVLAIGLPPLFASIEHGGAFDNRLAVVGYVLMRLALVAQWIRVMRTDSSVRSAGYTYALFIGSAQLGWIVLAALLLPVPIGLAVSVVLLIIEILGPIVAERRGRSTPWHPHHLAERYSLLTIIALGETVLGTLASATEISAAEGWTLEAAAVIGVGLAMSFALWWTYFLLPHSAVLAVRRDKALPWVYGHVLLFVAIAAVGAGLHVVGFQRDPRYAIEAVTVVASIAVPLVVFMIVRYLLLGWLMSALPRRGVLETGVIALPMIAIALAAGDVPVWACLVLVLASPLAIIVSFELGGWRLLDAQLARASKGPANA
jgi:low temperature requirement protein LtrA